MHKSPSFWQGFRDGSDLHRSVHADDPGQPDGCCYDAYRHGFSWGASYRDRVETLKSKIYWLAPLGAALWFLADKVLHVFGWCIGG